MKAFNEHLESEIGFFIYKVFKALGLGGRNLNYAGFPLPGPL